jgi:hypothetical protein
MNRQNPYVIPFGDYHDIDCHKIPKNWRAKEVAFGPEDGECVGRYWGLFWKHGNKPTRPEIKALLKKAGFDSKDEMSDIYK